MPEIRVRYKGGTSGLMVTLIRTWHRDDVAEPVMSASSGPKDYIKNYAWQIFEADPDIDAVSMVRANGPPFFIIRKGMQYFDVSKREVEVAVRRAPASVSQLRRAESA